MSSQLLDMLPSDLTRVWVAEFPGYIGEATNLANSVDKIEALPLDQVSHKRHPAQLANEGF
jgi:hypothetical protein